MFDISTCVGLLRNNEILSAHNPSSLNLWLVRRLLMTLFPPIRAPLWHHNEVVTKLVSSKIISELHRNGWENSLPASGFPWIYGRASAVGSVFLLQGVLQNIWGHSRFFLVPGRTNLEVIIEQDPVLCVVEVLLRVKLPGHLPSVVSEESVVQDDEVIPGHVHLAYLNIPTRLLWGRAELLFNSFFISGWIFPFSWFLLLGHPWLHPGLLCHVS